MGEGIGGGAGARSVAVVLFTDLVGSTELRSRLGEQAADELRRTHDRLLVDAVEGQRGRVVKNLGDGVMAVFRGAADAVGAAVAIQQAIDRHNRKAEAALEVRVGLSAGDVSILSAQPQPGVDRGYRGALLPRHHRSCEMASRTTLAGRPGHNRGCAYPPLSPVDRLTA